MQKTGLAMDPKNWQVLWLPLPEAMVFCDPKNPSGSVSDQDRGIRALDGGKNHGKPR